jgi:hypothetical protein
MGGRYSHFNTMKSKQTLPERLWGVVIPVRNPSIGVLNIAMILLMATMIALTLAIGRYYSHVAVSAVICPVGIIFGWAIGVLLSPYEDEGAQFSSLAKGISAFLSGYAVSKIDTIFTEIHQTPGFISHLGLFCGFFLLTTLTVFVNRTYKY